jgi:hypothetical protein
MAMPMTNLIMKRLNHNLMPTLNPLHEIEGSNRFIHPDDDAAT